MGIGTYLLSLCKKVLCIPASLFKIALMTFRHMFLYGTITMFFIASFMQGNALMLVVDFYCISIINHIDFPANITEGYTVVVPVLSQGNVIILLNFTLNTMSDNITAQW